MKAWLAFDTSSDLASFALKVGDKIWTHEQQGVYTHAEKCLIIIQELFKEASISLFDLDGIIIGRGPGSFTGLRVACAVAKGLAFAESIPLYPVSNLMCLAWQARQLHPKNSILSLIDARMQQVYWAYYPKDLEAAVEHVSCISEIKLDVGQELILVGYQIEPYLSLISNELASKKRITGFSDAKSMISMVEAGLIKSVSTQDLEPVYVRNQVTHGG
jgi:tRNA threonylcarbamoyladenosine biosynthesis protein TsaB